MITQDYLNKLVFFNIETASYYPSFTELKNINTQLSELWEKKCKYFRKNFDELEILTIDNIYDIRAGLEPEFGRIVCVSYGMFLENKNPNILIKSYYGKDEINNILLNFNNMLNGISENHLLLCGFNIKTFDIPFIVKRLIYNNINPHPYIAPLNKKHWELPFIDITELFSFGNNWSQNKFLSLDLLSESMGIISSKLELDGSKVNKTFWNNDYENIKLYCESKVKNTMEIMKKLCFNK
jgi:hypothetical protein